MADNKGVALVLAAGDGIGAAIVERFAVGGYHTVIVRREPEKSQPQMDALHAQGCALSALSADVRDEQSMSNLFARVESDIGPIEVCIYNGGANTQAPLEDTTGKLFSKVWELCCFGGFLTVREAAKVMKPRQRGTIIFSGATSGIRGKEGLTAFSSGKFGLRSIAQSAAKELAPDKIHVAHIMINGGIISDDIARLYKARSDIDIHDLDRDRFIDERRLAEAYWFVSQQSPTCWTHELDIRTYQERW
ncbi:MAG: SDR family NAD(P)-dependent oxidoreductase [Pseudomonadota bacterium]